MEYTRAHRLNNTPIVFASSDKAYGDSEVPFKGIPAIRKFYKVSKSSADLIAQLTKTYDLKIITQMEIYLVEVILLGLTNISVIRSLLHGKTPYKVSWRFYQRLGLCKRSVQAYIKVSEALLVEKQFQ